MQSWLGVAAGRADVYDLTVEGEHEFFANGVLVHNSVDAGRYGAHSRWGAHEPVKTKVVVAASTETRQRLSYGIAPAAERGRDVRGARGARRGF